MAIVENPQGDRLILGEPVTFRQDTQAQRSTWELEARAHRESDGWHIECVGEARHRPHTGGATEDAVLRVKPDIWEREPTEAELTEYAAEVLGELEIDCPGCDGSGRIYVEEDEEGGYDDVCPECHAGKQTIAELRPTGVSVATLARAFEVAPRTVHGWIARHEDFPAPVADTPLGRLYDMTEVGRWHAATDLSPGRRRGS